MPISTATGLQRWCLMRTISLVFPTKPSKVSRRQLLFSQRSPQGKFLGGGKSITVTSSIYYLSLSQCFSKPYPLASSTLHNLFSFLILFNSALCFSPPFPFVQQYFKEKKKKDKYSPLSSLMISKAFEQVIQLAISIMTILICLTGLDDHRDN